MEKREATIPAEKLRLKKGERIANTELRGDQLVFTIVKSAANEAENSYRAGDFSKMLDAVEHEHEPLSEEELNDLAGDDPRLRRFLIDEA